jgi:TP901 family phage tail tape measure protein
MADKKVIANYEAQLSFDASKFKKGMAESEKDFSTFRNKMKSIGNGIVAGIGVAVTAATGSLVAFGKSSIDAGKEFDSAVSQIAATCGKTVDQITELRDKAIELGSATSFSATQVADAENILAMAGLNEKEIVSSVGDVLNLAAAGSIEMGNAASYVTGAVKGFNDEFSNTQYYTDLMAKGATLAATDVNSLGAALSRSSSTAASFNQSAEDTTVALLRLAEQNVTGEAASTALARAMTDLYTPTDSAKTALDELGISMYDSNGNAKEFNGVVDELNAKLSTMSQEQANAYKSTIFTSQGLRAFNMMTVSSTEKVQSFRDGLASASDGIGSAAQQAETMLDNLQGDITIFGSAVEGLQIGVSDSINGLLRDTVQFGTEQIGILTEAVKKNGLEGLAGAVGEVLSNVITKIGEYLPKLINLGVSVVKSFLSGLADNADEIAAIMVDLADTIVNGITDILPILIQTAFNIVSAIANALAEKLPTLIPTIVQGIMNIVQTIIDNLPTFLNAVLTIIKAIAKGILDSLPVILQALPNIIRGIVDFVVSAIPQILNAIIEIVKAILNYLPEIINSIVSVLVQNIPVIIQGIITIIDGIVQALPELITAIVAALPDIITSIINAIVELLPVLIDGLIQLVLGIVEALPEIIKALIEALPQIITAVITGLMQALPQLITGLIELVLQLVLHLPEIIMALVEAIPDIIDTLIDTLLDVDNLEKIIDGLIEMNIKIVENMPRIIAKLIEAIPKIVEKIVSAFGSLVGKFVELGGNMIKGLWEGISNFGQWLWDKISGFFGGIWDGICNFFGIHSPSTLFRDGIGKNLVLGLAEGINAEADTAAQAMQNVNNAILDNANAELESNVKLSAETDYNSGDYTVAFIDPLMMFADRLESIFANANISLNESARYGVNGSGTTINNNSTTGGDYQINAPITVTVEGNADEATAERIGDEVERVLMDIISIKNLT